MRKLKRIQKEEIGMGNELGRSGGKSDLNDKKSHISCSEVRGT